MSTSQLEKLLALYMAGEINFVAYRKQRAELVRLLTSGAVADDDTIPSASANDITSLVDVGNTSTPAGEKPFTVPVLGENPEDERQQHKSLFIVALMVFVALLTWYVSTNNTDDIVILDDEPINLTPNPEDPKLTKIDDTFIRNFIKRNDWSSEAIAEFMAKWQTLNTHEQAQLRQRSSFLKLGNNLRQRILEQKALSDTDPGLAKQQKSLLSWFANQLSIGI